MLLKNVAVLIVLTCLATTMPLAGEALPKLKKGDVFTYRTCIEMKGEVDFTVVKPFEITVRQVFDYTFNVSDVRDDKIYINWRIDKDSLYEDLGLFNMFQTQSGDDFDGLRRKDQTGLEGSCKVPSMIKSKSPIHESNSVFESAWRGLFVEGLSIESYITQLTFQPLSKSELENRIKQSFNLDTTVLLGYQRLNMRGNAVLENYGRVETFGTTLFKFESRMADLEIDGKVDVPLPGEIKATGKATSTRFYDPVNLIVFKDIVHTSTDAKLTLSSQSPQGGMTCGFKVDMTVETDILTFNGVELKNGSQQNGFDGETDKSEGYLVPQKGHFDRIRSLMYLEDETLASASQDGSIIIWDVNSRQNVAWYNIQSSFLNALSGCAAWDFIAAADGNEDVSLVDTYTGQVKSTCNPPDGNGNMLVNIYNGSTGIVDYALSTEYPLTSSPDCNFLAYPGRSDSVVVIEVMDVSGNSTRPFAAFPHASVHSVAFSPSSTLLATASRDGDSICVWSLGGHKPPVKYYLSEANVLPHSVAYLKKLPFFLNAAFQPPGDSILLVSTVQSESVMRLNLNDRSDTKVLLNAQGPVRKMFVSPEGKWCLLVTTRSWELWNLHTTTLVKKNTLNSTPEIVASFSPDGSALIVSLENRVRFYSLLDSTEIIQLGPEIQPKIHRVVNLAPEHLYIFSKIRDSADLTVLDLSNGRLFQPASHVAPQNHGDPTSEDVNSQSESLYQQLDFSEKLAGLDYRDGKWASSAGSSNDRNIQISHKQTGLAKHVESEIHFYDLLKDECVGVLDKRELLKVGLPTGSVVSNSGRKYFTSSADGRIHMWDTVDGKLETSSSIVDGNFELLASCTDSSVVVKCFDCRYGDGTTAYGYLQLWQTSRNRLYDLVPKNAARTLTLPFLEVLSNDMEYYAWAGSGIVVLWDLNTSVDFGSLTARSHVLTTRNQIDGAPSQLASSPDGHSLAAAYSSGEVVLWDIVDLLDRNPDESSSGGDSGRFYYGRVLTGHDADIVSVAFTADSQRLLSADGVGVLKIWDIAAAQEVVSILWLDADEYIITTPDGYYMMSRDGLNGIAYRFGNRAYPAYQFDLRYNRPDIVLQRLGYASASDIKAYELACKFRRELAGVKDADVDFGGDDIPRVELLNRGELLQTAERYVEIEIEASCSAQKLKRIQVEANGVPVVRLPINESGSVHDDGRRWTGRIQVELEDTVNVIQISAFTVQEVESLREIIRTAKVGEVSARKLYVAAIGVSHYLNLPADKQLRFADDDATNIVAAFKHLQGGLYDSVITRPLLDSQVTKESVNQLRTMFAEAGVNDYVVLFLSGHGVLSKDSTDPAPWYFGTYDIDPARPREPSSRPASTGWASPSTA